MSNRRLDLTPLDPDADPAWRERLVQTVMSTVRHSPRPTPDRYTIPAWSAGDILSELLGLTRPALAVAFASAAVMIVLSGVATNARARGGRSDPPTAERYAVAEALGMPDAVASWVEGARAPSAGEVVAAMGGY